MRIAMAESNFAALVGGLVEEAGEPEGARLKDIPLAEIYEDPTNPRQSFDKREIADLIALRPDADTFLAAIRQAGKRVVMMTSPEMQRDRRSYRMWSFVQ